MAAIAAAEAWAPAAAHRLIHHTTVLPIPATLESKRAATEAASNDKLMK